jgi:hypothetical protein
MSGRKPFMALATPTQTPIAIVLAQHRNSQKQLESQSQQNSNRNSSRNRSRNRNRKINRKSQQQQQNCNRKGNINTSIVSRTDADSNTKVVAC